MRIRNFLGTITIGLAIVISAFIYGFNEDQISIELALGVFGGMTTVLGIVMQTENSRTLEAIRRKHEIDLQRETERLHLRLQSYNYNKGTYDEFFNMRKRLTSGENIDMSQDSEFVRKFKEIRETIMLHSSSEVVNAWQFMMDLGRLPTPISERQQKHRTAMMILLMGRLTLSIRHDLGRENDDVDEILLLRVEMDESINDMIPTLNEIRNVRNIDEYKEFESSL